MFFTAPPPPPPVGLVVGSVINFMSSSLLNAAGAAIWRGDIYKYILDEFVRVHYVPMMIGTWGAKHNVGGVIVFQHDRLAEAV